jgi:hypothetical protein
MSRTVPTSPVQFGPVWGQSPSVSFLAIVWGQSPSVSLLATVRGLSPDVARKDMA